MDKNTVDKATIKSTYGGTLGGLLPLIAMIATIILLCVLKMSSLQNFWCAGFVGIVVGMFVYRDKGAFLSALIKSMGGPTVCMLVIIFIIAGVMSSIFTAAHLADSLLYLFGILRVPAVVIPAACFLVGGIISVSTGSSSAALLSLIPVLFPLGVQMGCRPGLVMGAIISGALFGDNLAPISDNTIVSAMSQEADVTAVVRSRLPYSAAAGIVSTVLFLVFGFLTTDATVTANIQTDATYVSSLLFLALPVLMVVMLVKKANFVFTLLTCDMVGIVMLLLLGRVKLSDILAAEGVIVSGIEGMVNVIIFMILIFLVVGVVQETGALNKFQEALLKVAKTDHSIEIITAAFTSVSCIMISNGLVTTAFCGPIVHDLVKPYKIDRNRVANYVNGLAAGIGCLLPYGIFTLIPVSMAVSMGVVDDSFNPMDIIPYIFYAICLVVMYWLLVLTGWGRKREEDYGKDETK